MTIAILFMHSIARGYFMFVNVQYSIKLPLQTRQMSSYLPWGCPRLQFLITSQLALSVPGVFESTGQQLSVGLWRRLTEFYG